MFKGSGPPIIEVSNRLNSDSQSLLALHEELKPDFIKMRIRMFEALIELSPDVESFKQTYSLLLTKREKYCPEDK